MRKYLILTLLIYVFMSNNALGQTTKYGWLHQNSWSLGFGFEYPRYISTTLINRDEGNYGAFLSVQRNFSEHVSGRFKANFLRITSKLSFYAVTPDVVNDIYLGSFDLLYYIVPCEPISPYAGLGLGVVDYKLRNSPVEVHPVTGEILPFNKHQVDYEMNAYLGAEWRLTNNWKLKTELAYHTAQSSKFDGVYGTFSGGILGGWGDTYITFDLGAVFYFGYGEKSHICDLYEGINANVDYDKIEEIVKRYQVQPSETDYSRIEDIVKRNKSVSSISPQDNWVLIGINFDFNKASVKPESIPILYNSAELLLKNPDVKVEIQGYTDNIGSDRYNQKLSLQRAETIKNFFIAKGVNAKRLTTVGYGKSKPIMDNSTEQGRSFNRRIELKVIK